MLNTARVAFCYDFDKTLCPEDMQESRFIPSIGMEPAAFWAQSNDAAREHHMDMNLAWMKKMIDEARRARVSIQREAFRDLGRDVPLFAGLPGWFALVNEAGHTRGLSVEHYVISSGLKEIIEGTAIAPALSRIYASTFLYDAQGAAVWPAQVVNYTNKTQFLFRIAKGAFDENDDAVNRSVKPADLHIPYHNLIYIGDSETDIPSMRVVKDKGGFAIGVFNPLTNRRRKVYDLFLEGRIDAFAPADYSPGQPLFGMVQKLLDLAAARHALAQQAQGLADTVAPYAAYRDATQAVSVFTPERERDFEPMLARMRQSIQGDVE